MGSYFDHRLDQKRLVIAEHLPKQETSVNSCHQQLSPQQITHLLKNERAQIGSKPRKPRVYINHAQLEVLEAAFKDNPYPDKEQQEYLATLTKLAEIEVRVWFQNRRAKSKREKRLFNDEARVQPCASLNQLHELEKFKLHKNSGSEISIELEYQLPTPESQNDIRQGSPAIDTCLEQNVSIHQFLKLPLSLSGGLRLPDTQVNHSMLPENCQRLFSGIGVKENDQNMREYSFSELDFLMTDAVPDIEEINPTLTIDYIDETLVH